MMKQQKIGEKSLEFCLHTVCVLILFYLLYVLYIFPLKSQHYLTFLAQRPVFILFPKCGYAVLLTLGIVSLKHRQSWFLINLSALGILFFWYQEFRVAFFDTGLNLFFLEVTAIFTLILTNCKPFVQRYQIHRSWPKVWLMLCLNAASVVLNELLLYFYSDYSILSHFSNQ